MEQLIPLIIMLIIGSLFRNKKKKDAPEKGQPKPFTAQQQPQSLKEKTKAMYEQLQKEMQLETERQADRQSEPTATPRAPIEVVIPPKRERSETVRETRSNRRPVIQSSEKKQGRTAVNTASLLPKSKDDLIKGVIFSEIFGPPKSKR